MSEFALDKLQKTADKVPEGQRTPELQLLLQFAECSREAEEKLKTVGARRKDGAAVQELLALPETFQGLVQFVRSVALGAEAAGVGLCSAEVLTLLKEALLQPIITREEDGSYQAHRPSAVCPNPSPLNILQLLASGVFLHVTGNPEPAIAMLSAVLSGVWPPPRSMQRRLVARQFVPTAEGGAQVAGEEGQAGRQEGQQQQEKEKEQEQERTGSAAGTASGSSSGDEPAGSSSSSGDQADSSCSGGAQAGSSSSDAPQPAEAPVEQEKQQAVAEEEEAAAAAGEGPTVLAAALGEALARHCPGVSLRDIHKSALVLRLFLGCRAVGEQQGDGPSLQAIIRQLLMDCQQLLDLDPHCHHAYVWAAQLLLSARWPMDRRAVRGLYEEGLRRLQGAQCWLAAGEVGHDFALWLVWTSGNDSNVAAKHAALLEAGKLLEGVKEAEAALQAWMPPGRLQQLTARRTELGGLLLKLQKGQRASLGTAPASAGASACAFCGQASPQLRVCGTCRAVGYCSRQCQVRDWRGGHKAVCTPAAQEPSAAAEAPVATAAQPAVPAAAQEPAQQGAAIDVQHAAELEAAAVQ